MALLPNRILTFFGHWVQKAEEQGAGSGGVRREGYKEETRKRGETEERDLFNNSPLSPCPLVPLLPALFPLLFT
jgi:hypothetical protein